MGIPADCDICHRQFQAEPENIIECWESEDGETPLSFVAVDYVFVCPTCEPDHVKIWNDDAD